MRLNEYQLVRDALLEVLSDYDDGISVERLAEKVSGSMPPGKVPRPGGLWSYLKRALIDLEAGGLIERVPGTNPVRVRPPVKGRDAFVGAARRGHAAVIKRLLTEGVEQEPKDAALISAVINDHPEVVRLLLDAGANVHAKESLFGKDATMYVTGRTSGRIVDLLNAASNNGT